MSGPVIPDGSSAMASDPPVPPEGGATPDLRESALAGARWLAISRVVVEFGTLVGSVVLARLVAPSEFGAVVPTALLIAVGGSLAMGSFGTPLVRAAVATRPLVQTAFALSLLTGIVVSLVVIGGFELYDFGYTSHQVHLIQVVAPSFFLFSLGAVPQALLERDLDFRRSALNEIGAVVPGTIVSVILAACGLGGLALAIGYLVMALGSSLQAAWWRRPPWPRIHRRHVREIVAFGLPTSASAVLYAMQRTIGFAILGGRLDTRSAGFFYRATQLGIEYQSKVTNILVRMLFPLLSRADSPDRMRSMRSRMVTTHTAFLFPPLALVVVLAPTLIPWVYGAEWAGAAQATQILAIVGFATIVNTGTGPVVLAAGHPRALFLKDAIELPLLIATLVVASSGGLITACWALAGFRVVSLLANQYLLVDRLCGIPIADTLIHDVLPAAVGSAAAAGAAYLVHHGLASAPTAIDLIVSTIVGLLTYALTLRAAFGRTWSDCVTVVASVRPPRRTVAA